MGGSCRDSGCRFERVSEKSKIRPLTPNSGGTGMESPSELGDLAANCGEETSPYKFDKTGGVRVVDRTYQTPSDTRVLADDNSR